MKKLLVFVLVLCCLLCACRQAPDVSGDQTSAAETTVPTEQAETAQETEPVPETTEGAAMVTPLPGTIDLNQLDQRTVAISLEEGDAYVDDTGVMQMQVTVYDYDLYDMVDISLLQVGDTILIRQEQVEITALEWNEAGGVVINGGLDVGGYELRTDEDGVFYEIGYSDVKSWYALGEITVPVSPDFQYTDSSDLDGGPVTYYPGDFLTEGTGIDYYFTPDNTTIVIENGLIIAMNRIYTP